MRKFQAAIAVATMAVVAGVGPIARAEATIGQYRQDPLPFEAYMTGLREGVAATAFLSNTDYLCLPQSAAPEAADYAAILASFLEANPVPDESSLAEVMVMALHDAFPCP